MQHPTRVRIFVYSLLLIELSFSSLSKAIAKPADGTVVASYAEDEVKLNHPDVVLLSELLAESMVKQKSFSSTCDINVTQLWKQKPITNSACIITTQPRDPTTVLTDPFLITFTTTDVNNACTSTFTDSYTFRLRGLALASSEANVESFIHGNKAGAFTTDTYADVPATFAAIVGGGTSYSLLSAKPCCSFLKANKFKTGNVNDNCSLSDQRLTETVKEALSIWANFGLSQAQVKKLNSCIYKVEDLDKNEQTDNSLSIVTVSRDVNGNGWFLNNDNLTGSDTMQICLLSFFMKWDTYSD